MVFVALKYQVANKCVHKTENLHLQLPLRDCCTLGCKLLACVVHKL